MRLERVMVAPNNATFLIPQIRRVLDRVVGDGKGWADPTAGWNSPAEFTNDLNPEAPTTAHGEGTAFLKSFQDRSLNGVLLDPPYSLRQVKDCYAGFGRGVLKTEGQRFWADLKDEAARIIKPGGRCLTFGWNSVGLGKSRGYHVEEVHLFPSGGMHNDTILVVDRRANGAIGNLEASK